MSSSYWFLKNFQQSVECERLQRSWVSIDHRYQAVYNYLPRNEDELELKEGDVVDVMEKCDDGWFVGKDAEHSGHWDKWNDYENIQKKMRL